MSTSVANPSLQSPSRRDFLAVGSIVPSDIRSMMHNNMETKLTELTAKVESFACSKLRPIQEKLMQSTDRVEIAKAYEQGLSQLRSLDSEFRKFLTVVINANLKIPDGTQPEEEADIRSRAVQRAFTNAFDVKSIAALPETLLSSWKLGLESIDKIRSDFSEHLVTSIRNFSRSIADRLRACFRSQLLGVFILFGNGCSAYSFVDTAISSTSTSRVDVERFEPIREGFHGRRAVRTTTELRQDSEQHFFHLHHLMNTTVTAPGNQASPLPTNVQTVLSSVPTWLESDVKVVEGMLAREMQATDELQIVDEDEKIVSKVEFVSDPALILGPFVLIGWKDEPSRLSGENARNQATSIGNEKILNGTSSTTVGISPWLPFGAATMGTVLTLAGQQPFGYLGLAAAFGLGLLWATSGNSKRKK